MLSAPICPGLSTSINTSYISARVGHKGSANPGLQATTLLDLPATFSPALRSPKFYHHAPFYNACSRRDTGNHSPRCAGAFA